MPKVAASIPSHHPEALPLAPQDVIEDYLERLIAPLVGTVPFTERLRLKSETAYHLQLQQEDFERLGIPALEAARKAIEEYGPASKIAEAFLMHWFERQAKHPIAQRFGLANTLAFSCFFVAQLTMVLILTLRTFLPTTALVRSSLTPAQMRSVWPEPLPFPDFTWSFFLVVLLPLLMPFAAGWIVGRYVPVRPMGAVYQGLLPITIYSLVIGALLQPMTEGLVYALFQIAFWLPVGCLTAHVSSNLARMKRMRAYDRPNGRSVHS